MDHNKHQQYYVDKNRETQIAIIRLQEENARLKAEIAALTPKG